jgi:hypothetical protein
MVLDDRKADPIDDTDKLEMVMESDPTNNPDAATCPLVEIVKIRLLETG